MAIVYQKSKGLTDAELHYCPGCNHGIVHKLVAEVLEEMGLLDDRKTAAQIVERCIARGYGINRARQALYEKKIPQRYWEEVLSDYPDQQEKIIAFLQSRLSVNPDGKERKTPWTSCITTALAYSSQKPSSGRLAATNNGHN